MGAVACTSSDLPSQCCSSEKDQDYPEVRHDLSMEEEITSISGLKPAHLEKTLAQHLATSSGSVALPADGTVTPSSALQVWSKPLFHREQAAAQSKASSHAGSPERTASPPQSARSSPQSERSRDAERRIEELQGLSQANDNLDVEEVMQLRQLMKTFVQEMVRGRTCEVLVAEGGIEQCKFFLTPNLQYIQLVTRGVVHDMPLRTIKDICPGKSLQNKNTPVELDDLCGTIVLKNNECITLRHESIQQRDEFSRCVKVLALALE